MQPVLKFQWLPGVGNGDITATKGYFENYLGSMDISRDVVEKYGNIMDLIRTYRDKLWWCI